MTSVRLATAQALKDEAGEIAVIVGAWHVPALRHKVPATEDRALIRGLPKVKVESAWVPWSDSRLAMASGYGAGVAAPDASMTPRGCWSLKRPARRGGG